MELTTVFLPVYQNPYQHLLTEALERFGVEVRYHDRMPSARWLVREQERVQVLHLHWLYGLYMNRYLTPVTWLGFLLRFAVARRLGYRIVWTAHNIVPHRMPFPPLDLALRQLVVSRADAIIAHCQYAADELVCRFGRHGPVHVIPHGNYADVHPITLSAEEARAALNIAGDAFVYGLVGNLSPYKGIEDFADVFLEHAAPQDVALIAGRNRAPDIVNRLKQRAIRDTRLRVHPGFIPRDEMQIYLLASDVMVFCFEEILTSGSVILAMSYGKPIVAPAIGCLPELVTPDAGILYKPEDHQALGTALRRIKEMNTQSLGARAKAVADDLRWDEIARQTAAVYRQCIEGS